MKFLVFAPESPALQGAATSEAALRTSGLVEGLRAHGHTVEVSGSRGGLDPTSRVHAVKPDVVVCGSGTDVLFNAPLSQPLVLDLGGACGAGLDRPPADISAALGAQLRSIAQADYFLVSGPRHRLYCLSFLLRSGVERAETRVAVVPLPLSPDVPAHPRSGSRPAAFPRLVSLPSSPAGPGPTAEGLLREFGVQAKRQGVSVQALPPQPYEALLTEVVEADVAVALEPWSLEGEMSSSLPSVAALWSGVPLVCREDTDIGDLVLRYDAGWTIASGDRQLPPRVVEEIFDGPAAVIRKAEGARLLARETFSWIRAVAPLLELVQCGGRGPRREMEISIAIPEDASLEVLEDRPVEQRFLSRVDGLCRVECCLARRGRIRVESVRLSLYRLTGSLAGPTSPRTPVAHREIADSAIRDNEWVELEFEPVQDSAGSTFALVIESTAKQEDESVAPWACNTRLFPLLDLWHGDRLLPAKSLCFRATSVRGAF